MDLGLIARYLVRRRQLRARERWSPDRLHVHQENALRELRAQAMARSPFYRRFHAGLEDRPLPELPVLTKAERMPNFDNVVTDREHRVLNPGSSTLKAAVLEPPGRAALATATVEWGADATRVSSRASAVADVLGAVETSGVALASINAVGYRVVPLTFASCWSPKRPATARPLSPWSCLFVGRRRAWRRPRPVSRPSTQSSLPEELARTQGR